MFQKQKQKDIRFILNIIEGYRRDLKGFNRQTRRNVDCGAGR
ncbi:MAG TPA: hypothetical protein VGB00_02555 [Pyrinomonadaceae bacterium]